VLGRLAAFYEPKLFYMLFICCFEVGSILCATAPTSAVFILGRAVSGFGAAGITAGGFALIGITPMRERPRLMAFFAALQAVAYTSGPTISGTLTDSWLTVSDWWRCRPLLMSPSFLIVWAKVQRHGFCHWVFADQVDRSGDSTSGLILVSSLRLILVPISNHFCVRS
jgi:MFS family permease